MVYPASTKTLYVIKLMWKGGSSTEDLSSKRNRTTKSTSRNQLTMFYIQDDVTDEYQLLIITSSGKVTPWNVNVDIEGVIVSMQ